MGDRPAFLWPREHGAWAMLLAVREHNRFAETITPLGHCRYVLLAELIELLTELPRAARD